MYIYIYVYLYCKTPQDTARYCNTLQHTATHCNTLRHNVTHCNTLRRTATQQTAKQHAATHCNTLQHTSGPSKEYVSRRVQKKGGFSYRHSFPSGISKIVRQPPPPINPTIHPPQPINSTNYPPTHAYRYTHAHTLTPTPAHTHSHLQTRGAIQWLRLVGSIKLLFSSVKEPYKLFCKRAL